MVKEDPPELILKKIEGIKEALVNPGNVLYDMYHSRTPKKDAIRQWGRYLESLIDRGYLKEPKTQISTIIRNDLKKIGADSAISWAKDVLPFKYKNPSMNFKDNTEYRAVEQHGDSSVLLSSECKKINIQYLTRLADTIWLLQYFKRRLETDIPLEAHIPEDELEEQFLIWDNLNARLTQVLDDREKIPYSTQHLLFYANSIGTLSDTYTKYVKYVKDFKSITPKQIGKILRGEVTDIIPLFDPKTRKEALDVGYYGQACPECGSFRTHLKFHSEGAATETADGKDLVEKGKFDLFCYACKWWFKAKTLPLGKQDEKSILNKELGN